MRWDAIHGCSSIYQDTNYHVIGSERRTMDPYPVHRSVGDGRYVSVSVNCCY